MKIKSATPSGFTLVTLAIALVIFLSLPAQATSCDETATTQNEMTSCALEDYQKMQTALDTHMVTLRAAAKDNPAFQKKLDEAQKSWEAFKQAQLDLLYFNHTGSAAPLCRNLAATQLTQQRLAQLKEWANPEDGDVCGGL